MQLAVSKEHITGRERQYSGRTLTACLPTCARSVFYMSHTHRAALSYLIMRVRHAVYSFPSGTHETSGAGGSVRPATWLAKTRASPNLFIRTLVKFRSHIEHLRKTIPRTRRRESRSQASRPTVRVVLHGLNVDEPRAPLTLSPGSDIGETCCVFHNAAMYARDYTVLR